MNIITRNSDNVIMALVKYAEIEENKIITDMFTLEDADLYSVSETHSDFIGVDNYSNIPFDSQKYYNNIKIELDVLKSHQTGLSLDMQSLMEFIANEKM